MDSAPTPYMRLMFRVENACLGPPATLRALEAEVALADLDDLQRLDLVSRLAEYLGSAEPWPDSPTETGQ
jgi:hypothetical protein